jgi:HlyD family secretion protein
MTPIRRGVATLTMLFASSPSLFADAPPAAPPAPASAWLLVTRSPVKVELDVDGVFEPQRFTVAQVDTLAWHNTPQSLEVIEGVAQGTVVKSGDVLVKFDTRAIDTAVRDLELAAAGVATKLQSAEQDLRFLRQSAEVETAAAQRAVDRAAADRKRFLEVDLPLTYKRLEENVKTSKFGVEYASEELRQLQKMYREESITEETEQIILARQRRAVDSATFALKVVENDSDKYTKVVIPRQQEDSELGVKAAATALEVAKATLAVKLALAEQALAKAQNDDGDARRKLAEMKHDQSLMTLKSPADGIVYYGHAERGKWADAPLVAAAMKPGGQLRPRTPIFTIVSPRPMTLRASVNEATVAQLRADLAGVVSPAALPDHTLAAKVTAIDKLPVAGLYDVLLSVTVGDDDAALLPGMACKIKLVPCDKPAALAVPAAAVRTDEEAKPYVTMRDAAGTAVKRPVKLGCRSGTNVEILEGLNEGDAVQPDIAKPATAAPAPAAPKN